MNLRDARKLAMRQSKTLHKMASMLKNESNLDTVMYIIKEQTGRGYVVVHREDFYKDFYAFKMDADRFVERVDYKGR